MLGRVDNIRRWIVKGRISVHIHFTIATFTRYLLAYVRICIL